MLTVVSLCSVPFFAVAWILWVVPPHERFILARPLPRLRPTLAAWATVIVILAIDFAGTRNLGAPFQVAALICVGDGATAAGVITAMMTARRSILHLWG